MSNLWHIWQTLWRTSAALLLTTLVLLGVPIYLLVGGAITVHPLPATTGTPQSAMSLLIAIFLLNTFFDLILDAIWPDTYGYGYMDFSITYTFNYALLAGAAGGGIILLWNAPGLLAWGSLVLLLLLAMHFTRKSLENLKATCEHLWL